MIRQTWRLIVSHGCLTGVEFGIWNIISDIIVRGVFKVERG